MTMALAETNGAGDLTGAADQADWLFCGWFTPDYRPLAETLARSLATRSAPFHLLAKSKPAGGWGAATRLKPGIAIEAMQRFAGKTIVLVDVDAEAVGDVTGIATTAADFSAFVRPKISRNGRTVLRLSTRVLVLRPTAPALRLMQTWRQACIGTTLIDEAVLADVWARHGGATLAPLPERFAARERDAAPADAALVHDSARDVSAGGFNIRRYFKRLLTPGPA